MFVTRIPESGGINAMFSGLGLEGLQPNQGVSRLGGMTSASTEHPKDKIACVGFNALVID